MKQSKLVLSKDIHLVSFLINKQAYDLLESRYQEKLHDNNYETSDFLFKQSIQNDIKFFLATMWCEYHSPKIRHDWRKSCQQQKDISIKISTKMDQLTLHIFLSIQKRFERVGSNCGKCYITGADIIGSAILRVKGK